jgi:hypothetical protein
MNPEFSNRYNPFCSSGSFREQSGIIEKHSGTFEKVLGINKFIHERSLIIHEGSKNKLDYSWTFKNFHETLGFFMNVHESSKTFI